MEAAPEPDDLGMPRARFGEPQRGLDRFGPARIELCAIQVAGRQLREQPHEGGPVLGGEAADVDARDLPLHRRYVLGMGVPEARHADAGEEIDVAVSVDRSEEHTSELQSPYELVCRL